MIVDYTTKPEGAAISSKGVIARCPICGRLGERQRNNAKSRPWRFVHVASIVPSPTGHSSIRITDKCTSPGAGTTLAIGSGGPVRHAGTQMVLGR